MHPSAPSSTEPRDGEMRLALVSPPSLCSGEDRKTALSPPTNFALFFTTWSGWVSLACGWQHSPKSQPTPPALFPEAELFCESFNQEAFTLSTPPFIYLFFWVWFSHPHVLMSLGSEYWDTWFGLFLPPNVSSIYQSSHVRMRGCEEDTGGTVFLYSLRRLNCSPGCLQSPLKLFFF